MTTKNSLATTMTDRPALGMTLRILSGMLFAVMAIFVDLAPKFYPVLSSRQRFWVAVFGAVAACCGAEPFWLRTTASRRGLMF